ncbi:hypothetical protein BU17DRAFT_60349 [Hysterangium stoloniferum]|nr:hypothetical protein BU17DRAFT_60349 [Hysterangium stoloniferum]
MVDYPPEVHETNVGEMGGVGELGWMASKLRRSETKGRKEQSMNERAPCAPRNNAQHSENEKHSLMHAMRSDTGYPRLIFRVSAHHTKCVLRFHYGVAFPISALTLTEMPPVSSRIPPRPGWKYEKETHGMSKYLKERSIIKSREEAGASKESSSNLQKVQKAQNPKTTPKTESTKNTKDPATDPP